MCHEVRFSANGCSVEGRRLYLSSAKVRCVWNEQKRHLINISYSDEVPTPPTCRYRLKQQWWSSSLVFIVSLDLCSLFTLQYLVFMVGLWLFLLGNV